MGKIFRSCIIAIFVVFCFTSASFAEDDFQLEILEPVHVQAEPEPINPEDYHFLLEPVDTSKKLNFKGCIAVRHKEYSDKQESGSYTTETLKVRTNGLYRQKNTLFPLTIDPVLKINFAQGKGPKKTKSWSEEYICPMAGVEIRNFGTIGTMFSLCVGKESGDKDNTVLEAELALYKRVQKIPVGIYTLYSKKLDDNENFCRGRIDVDPWRFGDVRLGICAEGENWRKSKDGKSNSHDRIGAGPHINVRIGETARLDLRCIFQTSDQGSLTSLVGVVSW